MTAGLNDRTLIGASLAHFEDTWPLAPTGPLPTNLLPPEYVHHVMFDVLPSKYGCSFAAIRRGLKSHLKRTAPHAWRSTLTVAATERDRAMAFAIANDSSARSRVPDLSFIQDNIF